VAEVYDMHVEALEVAADHVHVCVAIPPQQSVGTAVRRMKSMSARYMFRKFPDLRRTMWTAELWSPSYFVRAVGDRVTADVVRRYIEFHDEEAALGVQAELFPSGKGEAPDLRPRGLRRGDSPATAGPVDGLRGRWLRDEVTF
jgi:hypothetical protein